jgi:hypothetical protein
MVVAQFRHVGGMIERSLAEVSATVLKAARASQLPLAQAEDVSRAVAFLKTAGFDELLTALRGPFEPVQYHSENGHIVLKVTQVAMAGPAALDALCGGATSVSLKGPDAPELLKALVILANCDGLGSFVLDRIGDRFEIQPSASGPHRKASHTRVVMPESVWITLEAMAAKTYVPATEASRLNGAGAGLSDND